MKLSSLVIGLIFCFILILGGISFLGGISANYNKEEVLQGTFNKTLTRLNQSQQLSTTAYSHLQEVKIEGISSLFLIPYHLIVFGWKILKMIIVSVFTLGTISSETASELSAKGVSLPSWFVPSIIAVVLIIIIIIIIQAIFKYQLEH